MKTLRCFLIVLPPLLFPWLAAKAQDSTLALSIEEAVQKAWENQETLENARLDVKSADKRIWEISSSGLPQVNLEGNVMRNIEVQSQFLPPSAAATFAPPSAPTPTEVQAVGFAVDYMGDIKASVNQLLFSGSYIVGVKAAKVYKDLTQKQLTQSKTATAAQVRKAYYSVLVNEERLKLIDANRARLDSVMKETQALYEEGFAEKIDRDRLEVQINNLKAEKRKTQRLAALSRDLLVFQMGLPVGQTKLKLTTNLESQQIDPEQPKRPQDTVRPENRIEYQVAQTQRRLAELDLKERKAAYLPTFNAFYNFGYNNGRLGLGDLATEEWFNYQTVGVAMQWPIFQGLKRNARVEQARIEVKKAENGLAMLHNQIRLEIAQARTDYNNALEDLKTQERNMELAESVAKTATVKFEEGVGNNLEVVEAETDYQQARTNYFNALYNALVAETDYQKATGHLLNE